MATTTPAPRTAPVRAGRAWHDLGRGERIITGLLITWWALALLCSIWSAPQRAHATDLERAMTTGQIITAERLTTPPPGALDHLLDTTFSVTDDASQESGTIVQWSDRLHRWHWIPLDEARQVAERHAQPGVQYGDDTSTTSPETRTYWQIQEHSAGSHVNWEYLPAMFLGVMEFGLVIAGAARRGTRWFWFWLLLVPGLPLDAGLPLYIWSEVLHRGRWGRRRRVSGWYGLGLCFLAHVVAQMAIVTMGGIWQVISER